MPKLIALVGPPGAGKTTWRTRFLARNTKAKITTVSLDENRKTLSWCGCDMNQATTPLAVELAVSTTRVALAAGRTVFWDATNTERSSRLMLQVLAAEYGVRTTGIILLPPLAEVLYRNSLRDSTRCMCGYARQVPADVITSMREALVRDLPTIRHEGWNEVCYG